MSMEHSPVEHFDDTDTPPSVDPREFGKRALRLMGLSGGAPFNFNPGSSIGNVLRFPIRLANADSHPSIDDEPEASE